MRRVSRGGKQNWELIFPSARALKRNARNLRGTLLSDRGTVISISGCINCSNTPCIGSKFGEIYTQNCPVGAISIDNSNGEISISDKCISCGLCALVCPVGAIEWKDGSLPAIHAGAELGKVLPADEESQRNWLLGLQLESGASFDSVRDTALKIAQNLKGQKAAVFYPVVAGYLRVLGLDASASNMGDTNSRADVVIKTDEGIVPMEVKSYSEVGTINLKSVQQALENKLFTARQGEDNVLNELSSLALAFDYPSERVGLTELVDDIYGAFGIRIGLISVPRLIEAAIAKTCGIREFQTSSLLRLKGLF